MEYTGYCTDNGPIKIESDSQVPPDCINGEDKDYCRTTLPPGLMIKTSDIPGAGLGVFATRFFPAGTRFGAFDVKTESSEQMADGSEYCWEDGRLPHFVDASDSSVSNWMRFVKCARYQDEQCVTAYHHKGEMHYMAHRDIDAGTEILVYYGDNYTRDLSIQVQKVGVVNNDCDIVTDIYQCQHCRLTFSKLSYLNSHLKNKHEGEIPDIKAVDLKADNSEHSYELLNFHQQRRIRRGKKLHKCETCGKYFSRFYRIKIHLRTHLGEKPYNCDQCCKCYTQISRLNKHLKVHTGEKIYKCDKCGKGFSTLCEITRHLKIHIGELPYKCDICGKVFTQSGHLKIHNRIHTGEKPYTCNKCGKCFASTNCLRGHNKTHSGEKPYKCDKCGKCFTQMSNLKVHQRVHTGEKPYKCDQCGKRFSLVGNLSKHLRMHLNNRMHTGEKPYKCDKCSKCFTHNSYLKIHQRVHTGEKPYKCDQCGKCFSHVSNLNKHSRLHIQV